MQTSLAPLTRGVVIGRFMPPHNGHLYLVHFALSYCDDLTIFVCTLPHEPIPGDLRYGWMRQLFPTARVVHITEAVPEAQKEVPGSTAIWARTIQTSVPDRVDYVFASEQYGSELARNLGAAFVPVDPARALFPVSATDVRAHPMRYWKYIPNQVRPYFLKRVNVLSTEHSSLARDLAARFSTLYVANYQAFWSGFHAHPIEVANLPNIMRSQRASEEALALQAERVLFAESSALQIATTARCEAGTKVAELLQHATRAESYDLYLLDLPALGDLAASYQDQLAERGARVHKLHAASAGKLEEAVEAVQELLDESS